MKKYFVVWYHEGGVIQSEVETDQDPHAMLTYDWVSLAAQSEEIEIEGEEMYDLFCVIDYPTYFYQ